MSRQTRICLALVLVLGVSSPLAADSTAADRFTFLRPPAPESTLDPANLLSIDIDRWSTDADRNRVRAVVADRGDTRLLEALRDTGRLGTLRWPGGLDYTVRYARQVARPDGGRDVVLVVERPLWLWWQSAPPTTSYEFTLVQLSLDRAGRGQGRVSLGVPVRADEALGVALADTAAAPVELRDVRSTAAT